MKNWNNIFFDGLISEDEFQDYIRRFRDALQLGLLKNEITFQVKKIKRATRDTRVIQNVMCVSQRFILTWLTGGTWT